MFGTSLPPNGTCKTHLCFSFSSLHVLISCLKIRACPQHSSCQIIDCLELGGIFKRFITSCSSFFLSFFNLFSFFFSSPFFHCITDPSDIDVHIKVQSESTDSCHVLLSSFPLGIKTLLKREHCQYPGIICTKILLSSVSKTLDFKTPKCSKPKKDQRASGYINP